MKCKQRNRCNSNMMRVTSTLALATGLLFPAPIAIQASGMQNANISVQQDNVTTGRIIDENGEPLIGVTVRVLKGNSGTVTDIDGNYSLRVAKGTQLKITYTGYKDQIIRAGGTAQMQPDELNLNEVVCGRLRSSAQERRNRCPHPRGRERDERATCGQRP